MKYDFAILGGGAAGLSLALHLVRSPLEHESILIVDKEAKNTNDRTWCFWTDQSNYLDAITYHKWPNLRFISKSLDRTWELSPFRYHMVRGLDFYNFAHAELKKHNVTFLKGEGEFMDGQASAEVRVAGKSFEAGWVFDSRLRPSDLAESSSRYNSLKQHFTGWVIETDAPVFDPQTVTLFDLRTAQRGGLTFFYILPFSDSRALVEYTLFSPSLLPDLAYVEALKEYLADGLGIRGYHIESTERGVIPMTDRPFPRRLGPHTLSIGTRAGRVKPSTGYAFSRIQRDSQRIVDSLLLNGHPFAIPPDPFRHRMFDSVILELLAKEPELGEYIFSDIFAHNPATRVLKFLDERSSLLEELQIVASPAPLPFLRALWRVALKRSY